MVPSYDRMGDWLEEIAQEFPDVFFEKLDGGIQLEEKALPDPAFPPGEMYIMGEYCHDMLGRYIVLYYGSFAALLADENEDTWRDEIFATIAHEFTHHLEGFCRAARPGRQGRGVFAAGQRTAFLKESLAKNFVRSSASPLGFPTVEQDGEGIE